MIFENIEAINENLINVWTKNTSTKLDIDLSSVLDDIEQVFVRAEVVGILPSGQKRVHLLADGADGIEFVTNENSLVKAGRLTTEPQIVRCKDCKHQEKHFYADKRRKDGGRYIYGCDLADGYSHVCLDDDFCSRGERKDG